MKEIDPNLPVNTIAKNVVSPTKYTMHEFRKNHVISSMTPLPMRQFCGPQKDNLTGRKAGRFTVIGCALFGATGRGVRRSNRTRWVVRCTCGRYQMLASRTAKMDDPWRMCKECETTEYLSGKQKTKEQYRESLNIQT